MSEVLLVCADARRIPLADNSVQCVVTSPPYFGLRKYDGEQDLVWSDWKGGYGLEPTIEMYVAHTIEILREIRRVLRPDGVCFFNLGDSYYSGASAARLGVRPSGNPDKEPQDSSVPDSAYSGRDDGFVGNGETGSVRSDQPTSESAGHDDRKGHGRQRAGSATASSGDAARDVRASNRRASAQSSGQNLSGQPCSDFQQFRRSAFQEHPTLKPKDLCLIPERVALAAQADGWWVRSMIIWAKLNPMPSSVTDRPGESYEHIIMFTKSEKYFWDAHAVREKSQANEQSRARSEYGSYDAGGPERQGKPDFTSANKSRYWPTTRNLRNVWNFATQPYSGAHFATFPEELPRTAILAATSPRGACSSCGAPWVRILKPTAEYAEHLGERQNGYDYEGDEVTGNRIFNKVDAAYETIGWRPTCGCGGCLPDDLEIINSPNGANSAEDDWKATGRQGMNRPRVEGEGTRPITRYEQRGYAAQIRKSPHRRVMESVAGKEAFEHYIRTDKAGARAVPPELLECWIERNWLTRVTPPDFEKWPATRPCIVLDPFGGSGTTGRVASELNRSAILLDLAYTHDYGALARERTSRVQREMFA